MRIDLHTTTEFRVFEEKRSGKLAVADRPELEAGMLDQHTARALLTAADEAGARVVMVGDRRQLPAVGIGGVVDAAAKWAPARIELTDVHRFRRLVHHDDGTTERVRDDEFADLSLRLRSGLAPGEVFDELVRRGEVRLHHSEADAMGELAWQVAYRNMAGTDQCVSVATNEAAALINDAVRDQLVDEGLVDDTRTVHGSDGLRIGVGDRVTTRSNDARTGVANRQVWTVTAVDDHGGLALQGNPTVKGADPTEATVSADYLREHVHLAYASTVHGVQGDTVDVGDVLATDSSDAASVYVGLTRGRYFRTVHMIGDHDTAREQWIQIAGRNRADLGLDHARQAAAAEAALYATPETPAPPRPSFQERMSQIAGKLATGSPTRRTAVDQNDDDQIDDDHEQHHQQQRQHGPRV